MSGTTITASTSVVLVDTASGNKPYIVYFPNISSLGRIITVRDNDGYASTGNSVVLSTLSGASFPNNQSTLFINQPYGYVTFSVQNDGLYSILNTFAFPTGSQSAYVYNLNTNTIGINDQTTNLFNNIFTSSGILYYNTSTFGDVTSLQLSNNINSLSNSLNTLINTSVVIRQHVAVGENATPNIPFGSIQYSLDDGITWYNSSSGTQGFSNGGRAIAVNNNGFYVACGNNYDSANPSNYGYLQWSFDGITWNNSSNTSPLLNTDTIRSNISYNNLIWHAVGAGTGTDPSTILWSKDGKVWKPSIITPTIPGNYTDPDYTTTGYSGMAYGRNTWLTCGTTNKTANSLLFSTDGSNWIPNFSLGNYGNGSVYDVVYIGNSFIALLHDNAFNNILVSPTGTSVLGGTSSWTQIAQSFGNQPGFLAANNYLVLGVNSVSQVYTTDGGYNWNPIVGYPVGATSKPYFDGSVWWVGTSTGIYYSITGSNDWRTNSLNSFPGGYANGVVSYNQTGNINQKLISTVYGIGQEFSISTFNTNSISTGSFTIVDINNNGNESLYITSFNDYAKVFINNIVTSTFQTSTFEVSLLEISTINVSTLFASDKLITSTLYVSTIFPDIISTSGIYFSSMYGNYSFTNLSYTSSLFVTDYISVPQFTVSSIEVISFLNANQIQSSDMLTSTISITDYVFASSMQLSTLSVSDDTNMNIAYINTVSSFNTIASTIQLINNNGALTNLYAQSNRIYFEGIDLTSQATNPTFYKYTLQDTSLGITENAGLFSVDNQDLDSIININLNTIDESSNNLTGLFANVGINSVLHIINGSLNTGHIYKITNIIQSEFPYQYFTFTLSPLVARTELLVIGNKYSIYIANIGIPRPPTAPTNIVSVKANIAGSGFNFTGASVSISANIGTYVGSSSSGGTSFYINLSQSYSLFNIPAVVGSIVYFNGSGYNTVNVKFGSISPSNGATIVINDSATVLSVSGLTLSNFLGVTSNGGYPSLIITMQFLN